VKSPRSTPAPALASLYRPLDIGGGRTLRNRVALLPMTRTRAEIDGTPTALMAEYYAQRAEAGLIVTESTAVSEVGRGFLTAPGMYTTEHALGWREVTDAVHARGGTIFLQLNHVGRVNNLQHLRRPVPPVAPSAMPIPATERNITVNIARVTPYARPRALDTDEVPLVAQQFGHATRLAVLAGFDGVQVHADSGYLIHQFLSTNVNRRTDRYGGTARNRARFALEVIDAVTGVNGPEYVAMKLTPGLTLSDIEEDDIDEKYGYLIDELNRRGEFAFLHMQIEKLAESALYKGIRANFRGPVLAEDSRPAAEYAQWVDSGTADLVGFGRDFISNPDLPERLAAGHPLAPIAAESVYTGDATGYTDYPRWSGPERPSSTRPCPAGPAAPPR
jgi:N-ethylmaleimide reductase